jgi:hypothetical protein
MWILLITWISLEPNLAELSKPISRLNSKVLYNYESKELCEWAKDWTLENNAPSKNPTMRAFCVQSSQIQPNEDSQSSPAQ